MGRVDELRASFSGAELAEMRAEWAETQRAAAAAAGPAVEVYARLCAGRSARVPARPSAPVLPSPSRAPRPHMTELRPDSADCRTRSAKVLEAMLAPRAEDAPVVDRVSGRVLEAAVADIADVPADERGWAEHLRLRGLSDVTLRALGGAA